MCHWGTPSGCSGSAQPSGQYSGRWATGSAALAHTRSGVPHCRRYVPHCLLKSTPYPASNGSAVRPFACPRASFTSSVMLCPRLRPQAPHPAVTNVFVCVLLWHTHGSGSPTAVAALPPHLRPRRSSTLSLGSFPQAVSPPTGGRTPPALVPAGPTEESLSPSARPAMAHAPGWPPQTRSSGGWSSRSGGGGDVSPVGHVSPGGHIVFPDGPGSPQYAEATLGWSQPLHAHGVHSGWSPTVTAQEVQRPTSPHVQQAQLRRVPGDAWGRTTSAV